MTSHHDQPATLFSSIGFDIGKDGAVMVSQPFSDRNRWLDPLT
jgi:hypothetical protein